MATITTRFFLAALLISVVASAKTVERLKKTEAPKAAVTAKPVTAQPAVVQAPLEVQKTTVQTSVPKQESNVLVTIEGKPAVTLESFNKFVESAISADAQLRAVYEQHPDLIVPSLLQVVVQQQLISHWAEQEKVSEKQTFQKKFDEGTRALRDMLYQEAFVEAFKKEPTEADVRKYYDEHREIDPMIVIQQGGVKVKAVVFEKEEDAKNFLAKAEKEPAKFVELAQDAGKKPADYGLVNSLSLVDPSVKERAEQIKEFPKVELVKAGETEFIVFVAESRQEAKFKKFEDVKDALAQRLVPHIMQQAILEATDKLSAKFKVDVNQDAAQKLLQDAQAKSAARKNERQQQPQAQPKKETQVAAIPAESKPQTQEKPQPVVAA